MIQSLKRLVLFFLSSISLKFVKCPEVGERWTLDDDHDPFRLGQYDVSILEIKSGWVKYSMGRSNYSTKKMNDFLLIYSRKKT